MDRCKHGHEWTPENTRLHPRGGRQCIACGKARSRKHYLANREAMIESAKQWRLAHPEAYAAHQRRYYATVKGWLNGRRAKLKGERERIIAKLDELSAEEEELCQTLGITPPMK